MNKTPINSAKQFIKDCTKTCSNEMVAKEPCFHEWVTPEQALKAIEIAKEEWLNRTCEWLEEEIYVFCLEQKKEMIENFKKSMED